jgi:hypothetical protein
MKFSDFCDRVDQERTEERVMSWDEIKLRYDEGWSPEEVAQENDDRVAQEAD